MPVSIRVCFLGLCLLIAQGVQAQTNATIADWNRHCLDGTSRARPATPTVVLPLSGGVNVPVTTTLTIDTLCAVSMDVYLGTSSSPPKVAQAVPIAPYKPATALLPNTKYFWKVVVVNVPSNGTVTSATWSFTTAGAPPPVNQPPVVTIQAVPPVTLPAGATLNGSATDDGLPSPPAAVTYAWSKVSGPGSVVFSTPAAPSTGLNFSGGLAGTYVLRLTVSDSVLSGSADVTVVVNPPGAPQALILTYVGKTRDAVGPSEGAGTDGQPDGEFLLALSATATVTQVRLDSQGSGGNGTWDTVPGNGAWRVGVALTPTGALVNAGDGSITVTAQALSAFVADGGYLAPGAQILATVMLNTGMALTSTVTIPSGGGDPCTVPCVLNPTRVEFDVSSDHATVTRYQLEATGSGASPITKDLGKPTPDAAGHVSLAVPEFATAMPGVLYSVVITVYDATGQASASVPSNPFMRQ